MIGKIAQTPALVAIMNNKADFARAAQEHWYRIPVRTAPKRMDFGHLAFYQTKIFGEEKWAVNYFAAVKDINIVKRFELLPQERDHPRAQEEYYRVGISNLERLPHPIPSRRWRRIVFIPTTLEKLLHAQEINDLWHESPLEDKLWRCLKKFQIPAERQFYEGTKKRRYCLDFAIFCAQGRINVECDSETWHSDPDAIARDNQRDEDLVYWGWSVLRFSSQDIRHNIKGCIERIQKRISELGGLKEPRIPPDGLRG